MSDPENKCFKTIEEGREWFVRNIDAIIPLEDIHPSTHKKSECIVANCVDCASET